jgi:hypothetical protein
LRFEEADHQAVGLELRDLGVSSEAIHEIEEMPGALAKTPLGLGGFDIGKVPGALPVALAADHGEVFVEGGIVSFQRSQEAFNGAGEKPQPGEMGHVGGNLGGVQSLLVGGKAGRLDHLAGHVREDLPGHLVGAQTRVRKLWRVFWQI